MSSSPHRAPALLWSALVAALGACLALQLWRGAHVETNILALLPKSERAPVVDWALDRFTHEVSQKLVFLVGAEDSAHARAASVMLRDALKASADIERVILEFGKDTIEELRAFYAPFGAQLLTDVTRRLFAEDDPSSALARHVQEVLLSPHGTLFAASLAEDPLLLSPSFIENLPRPSERLDLVDGLLEGEYQGRTYVLLSATMRSDAFSRPVQERLSTAMTQTEKAIRAVFPDVEIIRSGMVWFADASATEIERETSWVSIGASVGIATLLFCTFRTVSLLCIAVLPLLVGLLSATVASFAFFSSVHILTLGFGASLLGVAIDYSIYFLCERTSRGSTHSEVSLRTVLPGLLGALATTVFGYAALIATPFPGLQQMSLFSCAGLFGAFGTVYFWLPPMTRAIDGKRETSPRSPPALLLQMWRAVLSTSYLTKLLLLGTMIVLTGIGITRLTANDNIRILQHLPETLIDAQKKLQEITGVTDSGRFLLVLGRDQSELLQRAESLAQTLDALAKRGLLGRFQNISNFIPAPNRQEADRSLVCTKILSASARVNSALEEIGVPSAPLQTLHDSCASTFSPLSIEHWITAPVSSPLRQLWLGRWEGQVASLVTLGAINNLTALSEAVNKLPGVLLIDKVTEISTLLGRYRLIATYVSVISLLPMWALLALRYGGARALVALLPPLAAVAATLALMGFLAIPLNLFTVFGLLLVVAIGVDYTIFFSEEAVRVENTALAASLSAASTFLSFGLLAFGKTPVLHTFGFAVAAGIIFSLIFAPLPLATRKREH